MKHEAKGRPRGEMCHTPVSGDTEVRNTRKAAEEAAAKQAADESAAKSAADAIQALSDSVGLGDKEAVAAARAAYDALTEDQKKLIPGDVLSKLATAEQQIAAAEEAARTVDISTCEITVKDLAYTGKKVKKPSVTVRYGETQLTEGADYSFTYNTKAKAIGTYKLTVTGMGRYTGSVDMTFNVVPKGTAFSKVTGGDKQVTLKWKSQKNITGYQIEYSLKKDFSRSKKGDRQEGQDADYDHQEAEGRTGIVCAHPDLHHGQEELLLGLVQGQGGQDKGRQGEEQFHCSQH